MHLSRLDIHGFKSFASATELQFDPGITAIVGPNGCGKSNIVDAIRWVIGEQRASVLRSDKMDSVIFNGTAWRPPLGMAEVRLTVQNTRGLLPVEFSEITLGRRLYRSGDAEYLLNGTTCRLRDIRDLFVDTGMGAGAYSVIELKMVDEILSDNAQDRRRLFEEAAGITKYKQRRTQALRKLGHTQADLARIRDVTEEIAKRVRSLKRQARAAARHKRFEVEVRELELSLAQADCNMLARELAALRVQLNWQEDELSELRSCGARDDADREALRLKLQTAEHTARENQQTVHVHEARVSTLEGDLRLAHSRLEEIGRDLARLQRDEMTGTDRAESLCAEEEKLGKAHAEAVPHVDQAVCWHTEVEEQRDEAKQKVQAQRAALSTLRAEEQAVAGRYAALQRRIDQLNSRLEWLNEAREHVGQELELVNVAAKELEVQHASAESVLNHKTIVLNAARAERDQAQARDDALGQQAEAAREQLRTLEREHVAREAELALLNGLLQSYEEFPDAVRHLSSSKGMPEVRTLSDVVTCVPEHRAALAAALGAYGACIVVQSADEAHAAIAELKAQDKGRAFFLVLDRLPQSGLESADPDVATGMLRDLVTVQDSDCHAAVDLVLRNVCLAEDLEAAERLRRAEPDLPVRYVTPAGEWLDDSGFLYAGGREQDFALSHLDRRDRLQAVQGTLAELEAHLADATRSLEVLKAARETVGLEDCKARVRTAEESQRQAVHKAHSLAREVEHIASRCEGLRTRLEAVCEEIEARESTLRERQPDIAAAEAGFKRMCGAIQEAEARLQQGLTALQEAQESLATANVELVGAQATRERLEHDLVRIRQRQTEFFGLALDHPFQHPGEARHRKVHVGVRLVSRPRLGDDRLAVNLSIHVYGQQVPEGRRSVNVFPRRFPHPYRLHGLLHLLGLHFHGVGFDSYGLVVSQFHRRGQRHGGLDHHRVPLLDLHLGGVDRLQRLILDRLLHQLRGQAVHRFVENRILADGVL